MITYNGNFVSKIKYNGIDLRSVLSLSANNVVWMAPTISVVRNNTSVPSGSTISISRNWTYIDFDISFNVPLSQNRSGDWFSSPYEDLEFTVQDILYSVTEEVPNIVKAQWRIEFEENTGAARTGTITLKDSLTGDVLWTCTFQQAGITWTTTSVTCTCNPTTISTNQSDETNTWTVSGTAYKTQTSNIGTTRNVGIPVQYTFTSNSVIDRLEQFARPVGSLDFKYTVWRNRNKTGLATITFTASADGYTDTATCRISVIGGVTPVPNKSMTLNFRSAGISNVWLFNSTVSNMSLPTNNLSTYVVSGSSLKLTWSDKLTVNTNVGGQTSISEGDRFYVYYSIGGASTIGQTVGSSASYILSDGSSVTIA